MTLTRIEFGNALGEELNNGYDPIRIARWAYQMHLDANHFEPGLEGEILKLIAMDQGPEFEMSEAELRTMVTTLQSSH